MKNITKKEIILALKNKKEYSNSGMTVDMVVEEIFHQYPNLISDRHKLRCSNLLDNLVKNGTLISKEINNKVFYKKNK